MKVKILLCSMLLLGSLSYAAEADSVAQEVMTEVKNIEAEYQALMQKEAESYCRLMVLIIKCDSFFI